MLGRMERQHWVIIVYMFIFAIWRDVKQMCMTEWRHVAHESQMAFPGALLLHSVLNMTKSGHLPASSFFWLRGNGI